MITFLIVLEIACLLLLISMVYSLVRFNDEYRAKLTRMAQNMAALDHRIAYLEQAVEKLKHRESGNGTSADG